MAAADLADSAASRGISPPTSPTWRGPSPWLSGPAVDLLFGYGLAYILTLPLLLYAGQRLGIREWPAGLISLFSLAVAAPHYGATLLRAYRQPADRRRYSFFTVYASVLLVLLFAAGLYDAVLGSWLLTIYITWSPWHFAGQNYGLAVMSLRRRGVSLDPHLKRPIYASFILSALLAVLSLHAADATVSFAQGYRDASGNFTMFRLGIPLDVVRVAGFVLAIAYLATLVTAGRRLAAAAPALSASGFAPVLLLVATQALWFAIPAFGWATGVFSLSALPFAAIWLSVAHSVQYLWVSSYFARQSGAHASRLPYLGKAMLAGCGLSIFPALLLVPGLLGGLAPFSAGAAVLLFAVVNLHHFLLDGAIWKLREGPVARVLLVQPGGDETASGRQRPRRSVLASGFIALLWTVGAISLALPLFTWHEVYAGGQLDASIERSQTAVRRLAWLGRDSSLVYGMLGWQLEKAGDPAAAIRAYRKAATLPDPPILVSDRLGWLLVRYEASDPSGRREAVEHAERASALRGHGSPQALQTLSAAYANDRRFPEAQHTARRALALARSQNDRELVVVVER